MFQIGAMVFHSTRQAQKQTFRSLGILVTKIKVEKL